MLSGLPQRVVADIATVTKTNRAQIESDTNLYLQACQLYLFRMCEATKYEHNGIRASCRITIRGERHEFIAYANSHESSAQKVLESAITCVLAGFMEVER